MKEEFINNKVVVRNITLSGLLIALSIILTRFFAIPPGLSAFRLSLGTVPIITASILMGPFFGGIVGGLSDVVGAFVFQGASTLLVWPIISSTLYGVLPWLILYLIKSLNKKIKFSLLYPSLGLLFLIITIYVFVNPSVRHPFDRTLPAIEFTDSFRLWFTIISAVVITGLGYVLFFVDSKLKNRSEGTLIEKPLQLALAILIMEIFVDILYSSLWKYYAFGLNFFVSVFFHTIILILLLPVKTFIITLIVSADKYSGHARK